MPVRLFLVISVALFLNSATADDWPQWMGPGLDGISTEEGWSANWNDRQPQELWHREIGIGFSSVGVVDGLLYTMGHVDGKETVWCLNADTGSEVWSHSYPAQRNGNLYEGGPGATPTVLDNHVYTLGVDGQLNCLLRKTGELIWHRDLKSDFDVALHEWGFNSSPFIHNGKLYVQGGRLGCYDTASGDLVWKSEPHQAGYGAVRILKRDGTTYLVSLDCDGLRISNISDGKLIAIAPWKSPFATNSTTPIVIEDRIFISTGYNVGSGLFEFDGQRLTQVYSTKRMRNHFNNSIVWNGHIYGLDGNSNLGRVVTLTCLNFANGDVMWKQRGLGCGSVMIANEHLIVLSEDGDLVVAKASENEFRELGRTKILSGRCWTVPVLTNGNVYARNASGNLVCVELPKVD